MNKTGNKNIARIDAKGIPYRELNELIHQSIRDGKQDIILDNVNGHRYIGSGLAGNIKITINGVPGNDLSAFMDGPTIIVNSNAQDGIGNTMNTGKIIIHGNAGDIAGHSMRGGCIYIEGNVGYRTGIHMKSYENLHPVIIIGGNAGDFLGEYMAGGLIVVLGLDKNNAENIVGDYCGTGMHGGEIFLRGQIKDYQLGQEVKRARINEKDKTLLRGYLADYCSYFSLNLKEIMDGNFIKLSPSTHRPYGKLYAY